MFFLSHIIFPCTISPKIHFLRCDAKLVIGFLLCPSYTSYSLTIIHSWTSEHERISKSLRLLMCEMKTIAQMAKSPTANQVVTVSISRISNWIFDKFIRYVSVLQDVWRQQDYYIDNCQISINKLTLDTINENHISLIVRVFELWFKIKLFVTS